MTCIVGLVDNGQVYLGGDGRGANNEWHATSAKAPKVFMFDRGPHGRPWVLGYTTSFRFGQLLEVMNVPEAFNDITADGDGLRKGLIKHFIPSLQMALRDGGILKKEHEVVEGGLMLLGIEDRLFTIQSDFSVMEESAGYYAIGCGYSYALGSLHATGAINPPGLGGSPQGRIELALLAACRWSIGVGPPFSMVQTGARK